MAAARLHRLLPPGEPGGAAGDHPHQPRAGSAGRDGEPRLGVDRRGGGAAEGGGAARSRRWWAARAAGHPADAHRAPHGGAPAQHPRQAAARSPRCWTRLRREPTPEEEEDALRRASTPRSRCCSPPARCASERPTVRDEVEQGLYFLQRQHLGDGAARSTATWRGRCAATTASDAEVPVFLRYRSWIGSRPRRQPERHPGGDPLDAARRTAAPRCAATAEELRALQRELSLSDAPRHRARGAHALARGGRGGGGARRRRRAAVPRYEPYRLKLSLHAGARRGAAGGAEAAAPAGGGYDGARFRADLDLLDRCLRESGFAEVAENGRLAPGARARRAPSASTWPPSTCGSTAACTRRPSRRSCAPPAWRTTTPALPEEEKLRGAHGGAGEPAPAARRATPSSRRRPRWCWTTFAVVREALARGAGVDRAPTSSA